LTLKPHFLVAVPDGSVRWEAIVIDIHSVSKTRHLTFDHNFGKCRLIFKIVSMADSHRILKQLYTIPWVSTEAVPKYCKSLQTTSDHRRLIRRSFAWWTTDASHMYQLITADHRGRDCLPDKDAVIRLGIGPHSS